MADFNLNFIETDVLIEGSGLDMVVDTVYYSNDGRVFVSGMDFNNGDKPFAMELQLPEGTELQAGGGAQINKANKALLTEEVLTQAISEHKANIQHLKNGVDPHTYCEDTYKSSPGLKANTPDAAPQVDTKYAGYDDYLQRYQGDDVLPYILTEDGQNIGQDTIQKLSQDHPQFKQDMDMHMQNGMSPRDAAQHALVNIHPDLDPGMRSQFFDDTTRLQNAETLARIADKNPGFHDHFDNLMKQNGGFAETAAKGALVNLYPNLYTDLVPGENGLSQHIPDQNRMTSIALNMDGKSLEDLERHVDGRLEDTRNPLQAKPLSPESSPDLADPSKAYSGEELHISTRTGAVESNSALKGGNGAKAFGLAGAAFVGAQALMAGNAAQAAEVVADGIISQAPGGAAISEQVLGEGRVDESVVAGIEDGIQYVGVALSPWTFGISAAAGVVVADGARMGAHLMGYDVDPSAMQVIWHMASETPTPETIADEATIETLNQVYTSWSGRAKDGADIAQEKMFEVMATDDPQIKLQLASDFMLQAQIDIANEMGEFIHEHYDEFPIEKLGVSNKDELLTKLMTPEGRQETMNVSGGHLRNALQSDFRDLAKQFYTVENNHAFMVQQAHQQLGITLEFGDPNAPETAPTEPEYDEERANGYAIAAAQHEGITGEYNISAKTAEPAPQEPKIQPAYNADTPAMGA